MSITQSNIAGQTISVTTYRETRIIEFEVKGYQGVYLLDIHTDKGGKARIKVIKKQQE